MQPDPQRDRFNLRVLLVVSAIGWGMSFFAAFAPWFLVVRWIEAIGGLTPPDHPMIQYWVRMAGAGFGFIGLFYLRLALRPTNHLHWMRFASLLNLAVGSVILAEALILRLPSSRFRMDTLFCFGCGTGIWIYSGRLLRADGRDEPAGDHYPPPIAGKK
ncbi:MAG TPA: hypothetical protein VG826_04520 [Pirellulales bacterium]|nr:hypothetical protein [Pirellulales bacterium]